MAVEFPPRLADPSDPDSIAQWAREITELLSGQVSIGEPVAFDYLTGGVDALRPNGTTGNIHGSFVYMPVIQADVAVTYTHNLNIPNKGGAGPPPDLNVGWIPVRIIHNGNTVNAASTISVNYEIGDAVTANSIQLRWYIGGTRVIAKPHDLYTYLWFFPATI